MEIPQEKRWIEGVLAPLRQHGYTGSAYNRVFDSISKDEDQKGTPGARQRAERVVTALIHIVSNGLLPSSDEDRDAQRIRRIGDFSRRLEQVHRFALECTGDHKLPRVHRKRAGKMIDVIEKIRQDIEVIA